MTSKFSRAAVIAGIAIGASGLVAVPAEAAGSVSTANYYVNNPAIGSAATITPESATVSASVDTGGNFESIIPVSSSGLAWSPIASITLTSEKWNDGTAPSLTTTGSYAPVDGIPVTGGSSDVSVTITDAKGTTDSIAGGSVTSGTPFPVSNGTADNYSDVTFEYDPVSDYDANGDVPGPQTNQAPDIQVPTVAGVSSVSTTLGAFGQAAQNSTGNTPLTPGTKYYYWVVQQAGGTDQAVNVDIAAWGDTAGVNNSANASTPAGYNPTYKCYPIAAIEQDSVLNGYYQAYVAGQNPTVSYPNNSAANGGTVVSEPAIQGPCIYYYGNTGGALYYQSPNGEFTTPAIGTVKIGAKATTSGSSASVEVTDKSAYKASGTLDLTVGKKLAGTVKFSLQPRASGSFKVKLTAKGKKALSSGARVKVAPISQTATIASVSNWDQRLVGKSIKL